MNEIDKAALAIAIEAVRKESPSQCQRIDDMLAADEDWTDIGNPAPIIARSSCSI